MPSTTTSSVSSLASSPTTVTTPSFPLTSASLRSSTRSFVFGVTLAFVLCLAHFLANQWRAGDSSSYGSSWRQRSLEQNQLLASQSKGQRMAPPLALQAQEKLLVDYERRTGYSRRLVVDRFHNAVEVERMNDIKLFGVPRSDLSAEASWQSQLAAARLKQNPNSMRARINRDGATWTEAAAVALRNVELRRRQAIPRARSHPLVGEVGHAYYSGRTLILYQFLAQDDEAWDNLKFFIETAVREHHPADYVFLMQQTELYRYNVSNLPVLPKNARYLFYPGRGRAPSNTDPATMPLNDSCSGFGMIGWLLSLQHPIEIRGEIRKASFVTSTQSEYFVALGHYGYTMMIDSTVRGPWFPLWIDIDHPSRQWYNSFQYHLERNQPEMRVVSSTISCQYGVPHVQQGAIMVDAIGWGLIDANRTQVLQCIPPTVSPIYAELDLSHTMLNAGSNLGSQMLGYQEVDFRVDRSCLGMLGDPQYDEVKGIDLGPGHYLDPYEILFVKYTKEFKHYKAETFSDWKRWEEERREANKHSTRYRKRWTEADFRMEEESLSKEEQLRLKGGQP